MGETITYSDSKVSTTTNPQVALDGMYYLDAEKEMEAKKAEAEIMADLKAFHGVDASSDVTASSPVLVGQPNVNLVGAVVGLDSEGKVVPVQDTPDHNILGVVVSVDGDKAQVALSGNANTEVIIGIAQKPKKILGVIKDPGNKAGRTMKEKLLAKPSGKDMENEIVDMLMEDTGE